MENKIPVWFYLALLYGLFALVSLLVLITRGRPGFVKKKLLIGGMILTITGAMTACPSPFQRTCYARPMDPDNIATDREGWLDDNTIQATGSMHPNARYYSFIMKIADPRERARAGAKTSAIDKIIGYFLDLRLKDCKGTCDYSINGMALRKEFGKAITEGRVIRESFNEDGTCTIIYRVYDRNLKKKVAGENVD